MLGGQAVGVAVRGGGARSGHGQDPGSEEGARRRRGGERESSRDREEAGAEPREGREDGGGGVEERHLEFGVIIGGRWGR